MKMNCNCNVYINVEFTLWNIQISLIFKTPQSNICNHKGKWKKSNCLLILYHRLSYCPVENSYRSPRTTNCEVEMKIYTLR